MSENRPKPIEEAVQEHYSAVAERARLAGQGDEGAKLPVSSEEGCGCGCACAEGSNGSDSRLYGEEDLADLSPEAISASAGCGNPVGLSEVREGETVLDLGSGGGIDCFIAAKATGPKGEVIGVDMTLAMLKLAQENAAKLGTRNVTFKAGRIDAIPQADASVDLVISNCVIALGENKPAVFTEVKRILRPGGRFVISDIVTERPLPDEVRESAQEWVECIAGAELKGKYLGFISDAGFEDVKILKDVPLSEMEEVKRDASLRSITVRAFKPV